MAHQPTLIPGLRSPYDQVEGLVYFGRMLDKIRLHAEGKLPEAWVVALENPLSFNTYCCNFLGIAYADLVKETLTGKTDEELLRWAYETGRSPEPMDVEIFNAYLSKRGWRDKYYERLIFRLNEAGLPENATETLFDYLDLDEGRTLRF